MQYIIKSLTLGEVLDQAVAVIKDHFRMLFTISCYLLIPLQIVYQFILYSIMPRIGPHPSQAETEAFAQAMLAKGILIAILSLGYVAIYLLIAWPLTNAATVRAVASEYLGQPIRAGQAMKEALKLLLPLLGTSILAGLIIMVGLVLCIVPGIYFALRYWLATHTVVIEERIGWDALQRSSALMKGNMGAAFVLGFLIALISGLAGLASNLIPVVPVAIVVGALVQGAVVVFGAAAGVVFYFSCRCKLENFDLEILASAVAADEPEPPPAAQAQ